MLEGKVETNMVSLGCVILNLDNFMYAVKQYDGKKGDDEVVHVELGFTRGAPVSWSFYKKEADLLFEGLKCGCKSLKD